MKIGIICADECELTPFIPVIQKRNITRHAMLYFHEGTIRNADVVAVYSGVCKVNAAIAAQLMIDRFNAEMIINAGTAGGMDPEVRIFDTVISSEVCYHDVRPDNLTAYHPWLETPFFRTETKLVELSKSAVRKTKTGGKVFWGRIVTGESFITDEGRDRIMKAFSPLAVDMESAAIAHVCHVNSLPFISIRSITDTAQHSGVETFEENCEKAAEISKDITVSFIEELTGNDII